MKSALCVVVVFFFLCGCSAKTADIKPQTKGISFTASVQYDKESYQCDVSVSADGVMTAVCTEPDTLCGLTTVCTSDGVSLQYNGLIYNSDTEKMPFGCIAGYLYGMLCGGVPPEVIRDGDSFYTHGRADGCEYKMYIAPSGLPLNAEIGDDITVDFENMAVIKE